MKDQSKSIAIEVQLPEFELPAECKNLVATRFEFESDVAAYRPGPLFESSTSPFYDGVRWAVRRGGSVLSHDFAWEFEPMPSDRTDDFYRRCRFATLEEAVVSYHIATGAIPKPTLSVKKS